jgi:predicted GIY-YIG superfamily endonuclease
MAKKRDTYNYELKDGRKVVYRGTTNDPERRVREHASAGKDFTHMRIVGRAKSEAGARKAERDALARYRRNHRGENPRHNERDDG